MFSKIKINFEKKLDFAKNKFFKYTYISCLISTNKVCNNEIP